MKIWQWILSSIMLYSFISTSNETISILSTNQYSLMQSKAFYQNVDQNFVDYKADVIQESARSNDDYTSDTGTIFRWKNYADDWEEFKANYFGLDLEINMNIAFNWYNIKWQNTSLHIPLNEIKVNVTNWVRITQVDQTTTEAGRWDATHALLEYDCWVDENNILIRFQLSTWASNNYDQYYYKIDTRKVTSQTTYNYNMIKSLFNSKVNNKVLNLESSYSTSLQDERNKATETIALNNLIRGAIGDNYARWKPYISPYNYSDDTNQATITVKFIDPNTKKNIFWIFKVTIKFNLTQDYWNKAFKERLTITPGKVIDPTNPNGAMISDIPLKWEGKDVYGTTAFIRFDAAKDGSETMKVNNIPIQVIDNQFTFQMTDNQEHQTNEYDILLEKHDLHDFTKILGKYQVNYLIKQNVPNLDLTWYAWNPKMNPDQKKLIESTLPNGEHNPNYDSEVNKNTGTKTQVIWIKHQAEKPFPLDPLNKNGDIITDDSYDQGFLAEGSVSGMGIMQNFSDPWIKLVQRVKVDNNTLAPIGILETIKSDKDASYFSLSGTYLYLITDQKGATTNKFITIGQKWQDKYAKFLDVLSDPHTAVSFWSTTQGFHLKSYLVQYKGFNSKDIQGLSFEQVSSYWKEYVSDIKTQHQEPKVNPGNNIDLNTIQLAAIKMNTNEINMVRNNIITSVTKQLSNYQLEYNLDYQINNLETNLIKLLDFDHSGNAIVKLTISSLDTSIKTRNSTTITVRNSKHYDPNKVTDLSKIKFDCYQYNFSQFTIEQLRGWILTAITNKFQSLNINLVYQIDYNVRLLDNAKLEQFISSKELTNLEIIIQAEILSDLAINSTNLILINDSDSDIVPPIPPNPKPDPDPTPLPPDNSNWMSRKENLIIMSMIIVILFSSVGVFIFFKYRLKKGIGGKKIKH